MTTSSEPAAVLQPGYRLPDLTKSSFQRALAEREFSPDSIHNDAYTRKHGYPGALTSAYVLAGYMTEPMVTFFGSSWFTSGELSLKFIGRGVQQGDQITCRATVREVVQADDDGAPRVLLDVWMEKPDGSRPVVGTASAIYAGWAGAVPPSRTESSSR